MSTFLGPIHYWLYNKIQLQEGLTEEILKPHKELYSKLDSLCGKAERRPLEEAIDTGNIHGWLQEQITIVEGRFAAAVTWVLENENTDLERLTAIARDFGKKHPITATSAPEVFKALQDLLLDGMPCDHVNQVLEQNETQVIWKQTIDLIALIGKRRAETFPTTILFVKPWCPECSRNPVSFFVRKKIVFIFENKIKAINEYPSGPSLMALIMNK